jgi:anti-anti-sigma factor
MILSTRYEGRVAMVRIQGLLTASPALSRLKPQIDKLLAEQSSTGLVLDLTAVAEIDSSGLGELVAIHTSGTRRGVRVAFAQVNAKIREVLAVTRLDGVFTVCNDEASALQYVAQPEVSD